MSSHRHTQILTAQTRMNILLLKIAIINTYNYKSQIIYYFHKCNSFLKLIIFYLLIKQNNILK